MNTITKKQTVKLLRRVQKFQVEDAGKHFIKVNTYLSEKGKLWFVADTFVGESYKYVACYEYCSYEENERIINEWIKEVQENQTEEL